MFIVYSGLYNNFAHLETIGHEMNEAVFTKVVRDPEEMVVGPDDKACLILHGGEDISPSIYGELPSRFTGARKEPSRRDILEIALFTRAVALGIPILGICRGAQLACCLSGGKLVQHVEGHTSGVHGVLLQDGTVLETTSCHHQMMYPFDIPKDEYDILGCSDYERSDIYVGANGLYKDIEVEPELVLFKTTKCLAVQGHPEWMYAHEPYVQYLLQTFKQFF